MTQLYWTKGPAPKWDETVKRDITTFMGTTLLLLIAVLILLASVSYPGN